MFNKKVNQELSDEEAAKRDRENKKEKYDSSCLDALDNSGDCSAIPFEMSSSFGEIFCSL